MNAMQTLHSPRAAPKPAPRSTTVKEAKSKTPAPRAKMALSGKPGQTAKPTAMQTATPAPAPAKSAKKVPAEQCRQMVEECAYFLALERNFEGGSDAAARDWEQAEAMIAQRLSG